jgi:formate hydrogenlyase transcriptional activator
MVAKDNESLNDASERLNFEILLAEIAADFVSIPRDRIDTAIIDAQRRICHHLGFERSVIWQFNDKSPGMMRLSHVHDISDGQLPDAPFDALASFPWGFGQVLNGKTFTLTRTEDLPDEARHDREAFIHWGVKSCVILPLEINGKIQGALSFCALKRERTWPDSILQRLQLVARLFVTVLSRQEAESQLVGLRRFEALVTEISAHFVNLPADQIDAQIEDVQQRVCKCLGMDLSALWQWSDSSPPILTLTHLFSPPDGPVRPKTLHANEAFPWSISKISEGKPMVIQTESMPPEASHDQKMRRHFGVKTSVGIPLSVGAEPNIGFVSFDTINEARFFPEPIVQRLQLIAQILANAIIRKKAHEQLEFRRRFESLVTEISTRFVNLPAERIDDQIEEAQRRICDCLDVDLSALWQWSDSAPHMMTVTHLHSPPEGPERPEGIDALEAFPWALERVLRGEELVYNTEGMPPEAARDQESRRHFGIQSSVVIPLTAGGGPVIGILTFDTLEKERTWQETILEKLRLVARIVAGALARKRSELMLRESEMRLGMATESAGVGLWVMDADSDSVWSTAQTRRLFQFGASETLDFDSFYRKILPADRERVKQAVTDAIASGEALDIEFRIVLPDRRERWIRASGKRLPGAHGKALRLMGASRDISERKRLEARLRGQLEEIEGLKQQLEKENILLRQEIEQQVNEEMVYRSSVMKQVLTQAEQVACTDATVLIEGETGTGKELLARAVHRLSDRRSHPMATVNCAALPPSLVESELFGREKGAYTGALTRMTGRFEMADGTNLFLDEVGELSLDIQAKLLRVLEQGVFERLGSTKSIRVNVRILAATNQDLAELVATGRFRKDLYYRLNVFPIQLPPLRERPEDILPLTWAFIRQYEAKMGRRIDHLSRRSMDDLQRYDWPGNVRELRNVVERAMITCRSRTLEVPLPNAAVSAAVRPDASLEVIERRHIESVLTQTGWRISGRGGAAEILGLKRTTLQSRMKKLGIRRPADTADISAF